MPRKKNEGLHADRQKQIIDAARQCFIAQGFHQTSMRQILDTAEMSSGGAYNYFSSKAEIVKGLVTEERADIELYAQKMQSNKDPLMGIAQLISDIIRDTEHGEAVLATEIYAEACRNPEIESLTRANTDALKTALHQTISFGTKVGVVTRRYTAAELSEWLIALLEGYIGRIATNRSLSPKKAARMAEKSVLHLLGRTG